MARILLTAIGSFSAGIAIETLKGEGHAVIGCDIYPKPWIADAYNVDKFYQVPRAENRDAYIGVMEKICHDENVDYIIPLIDPEVEVLSGLKERFLENGSVVCVSDEAVIKLCRDKYKLPQFLIQQGIENILPARLLSDPADVEYPLMVKPISGRSSRGCKPVYDEREYKFLQESLIGADYIRQPLIDGNIVTVDVVRDGATDEVVSIPRRELLRTSNGAGTTVEIIENPWLDNISGLIAKHVGITGAVNFEFIESENGEFHFIEINPRFSAGLVFSHMAGYDMVANHLNCYMGKPIAKRQAVEKMIIARKYKEYVTMYL